MIVEAMSSSIGFLPKTETWGIFYAGIPSFRTTGGDQPTLPSNAFRFSTCQFLKETAVGHYAEMGPRVCGGWVFPTVFPIVFPKFPSDPFSAVLEDRLRWMSKCFKGGPQSVLLLPFVE